MNNDQEHIIRKLYRYLVMQKRDLILANGYCHGLTLLWLYEMSVDNEEWFYQTIKKIHHISKNADQDIEKFLAHIEWLQRPEKYIASIRQMDMNQTMESPIAFRFSGIFKKEEFENILRFMLREKRMLVFSGPVHTVGVFRRKNIFYFFNANAKTGVAKKITSVFALKNAILKSLFTSYGFSTEKVALIMHILSDESKLSLSNANFTVPDISKRTCELGLNSLYLAVESHDNDLVLDLLKKNAPVNDATKDGRFPLLLASYSGYADIVTTLLEYGAEPDLEGREGIPLYVASLYGHSKVVQTLLDFNADVNKADRDGETALFGAIENNHLEIVKYLIENNADVHIQRKNGESVLDIAQKQKKLDLLNILIKQGYSPRFFKDGTPIPAGSFLELTQTKTPASFGS